MEFNYGRSKSYCRNYQRTLLNVGKWYYGEDFHRLRENRTPDDVVRFESSSLHTTIASLQCKNSHAEILLDWPEVVTAYRVGSTRYF